MSAAESVARGRKVDLSAVAIPADATLQAGMLKSLVWVAELGMGFSGQALRAPSIYDERYWQNYVERASSPIAEALNAGRVSVVNRHVGDSTDIVDIGIGCGTFIESRGAHTFGFDVNPLGIEWLEARGLWRNPYLEHVEAVTFWDAMEHIHEPSAILANVDRYVFLSLPIFHDARHVLGSKHYKPNEHIWYWTRDGLIRWMSAQGFQCIEHGTPESLAGREEIHTFVFRRP